LFRRPFVVGVFSLAAKVQKKSKNTAKMGEKIPIGDKKCIDSDKINSL
jgi:hypothetical protein